MAGGTLPTFDLFDPVGSTLDDMASKIADGTISMFSTVMQWSVNQGSGVDWNAQYVRDSYLFSFTLAFAVGLPLVLIAHLVSVKNSRGTHSELWDVFLTRLPRWVLVSMFGVSIGVTLNMVIGKLNGAIIDYMLGSSAPELAKAFKDVILQTMTGSTVPVFVTLVLGLVIFLGSLMLFVSSLILAIGGQLMGVFLPLATLPDLSRNHRGITKKFLGLFGVLLFAMPLQLFIFGFFFKMVAANLDAGTVPGMVETQSDSGNALASLGMLVAGSLVMMVPLLGPFALLRLVSAGSPIGAPGGGGQGSDQGGNTPSSPGSPQSASMTSQSGGPASSQVLGGAGGGSAAGGGGAAGGGAAGGGAAAAAGGTAAAAAGAGAATGGVGAVAVAGLSAAGRMAHAAKIQTSGKATQTAQTASMATMHLGDDGGEA